MSTNIEWTDETWNPVTGCSKQSEGCRNCYALREWTRLSANPKTVYYGRKFTDVQCHPERLNQPLCWTRPRMIFVNSMSDLFHEAVPDEFVDRIFTVIAMTPRHTYQILTKRPERMLRYLSNLQSVAQNHAKFTGTDCNPVHILSKRYLARYQNHVKFQPNSTWPLPNVWLGVSVENQATADERIPLLLKTSAAVRWVSAEPLLTEVDLYPYLGYRAILCGCGFNHDETNLLNANDEKEKCTECGYKTKSLPTLDWIVAGGETGINARPTHPDWLKTLRLQCQVTGTKFLFKQWGEWGPVPAEHANTSAESKTLFLSRDGTTASEAGCETFNVCVMQRLGKRANGRLLDGVLHDGYPHDAQEGCRCHNYQNYTGWD